MTVTKTVAPGAMLLQSYLDRLLAEVPTPRATATPFDRRKNIGLHHLALSVGSQDALQALAAELVERTDTEIEFEPEALGGTGIRHMMCRVPGNIRLELIAA